MWRFVTLLGIGNKNILAYNMDKHEWTRHIDTQAGRCIMQGESV